MVHHTTWSREENVMRKRTIIISDADRGRLEALIDSARMDSRVREDYLAALEGELSRARVVPAGKVPPDVVTMNTRLKLRDLDSGQDMVFTLVFPSDADAEQGKISVLASIGTAVLGFRRGDAFEWRMPGRVRRLRVEEVLYQPEAAGDYHR